MSTLTHHSEGNMTTVPQQSTSASPRMLAFATYPGPPAIAWVAVDDLPARYQVSAWCMPLCVTAGHCINSIHGGCDAVAHWYGDPDRPAPVRVIPPTDAELWAPHLAWLAAEFSDRPFLVSDVTARAAAWVAPPGDWNMAGDGLARKLGRAYATATTITDGELELQRGTITRTGYQRWTVATRVLQAAAAA